MYAFISLARDGESDKGARVRLDQIAAVQPCPGYSPDGAQVVTISGAIITGPRSVAQVWDAMSKAVEWLEDGA